MAVSLPNEGEINLMIMPERAYHEKVMAGPYHPTTSASFLENITISKIGLVIFKYNCERDCAHFSTS